MALIYGDLSDNRINPISFTLGRYYVLLAKAFLGFGFNFMGAKYVLCM